MKKERSKNNMKKKLLLFIGILTLTLSFCLVVPKTKAQTTTLLEVHSYDVNAGTITFYDYYTQEFFGTFDFNNVFDRTNSPFITNIVNIPYIFRIRDVYILTDHLSANLIQVEFLKPADSQIFFTLRDMVDGQVYEYIGIVDNKYIFHQGLNIYRVPTTIGIYFHNSLEGEYDFETILKSGNKYIYMESSNAFWFATSPDYEYTLGYMRGLDEEGIGYSEGYKAGSKLAEGLLESEYQRGLQNGTETGYSNGYNDGYQNAFDDVYNEIISSDEYTLGYNDGFKDGETSKLAKNNQSFYAGIEKWLVPAIILVIVLGGMFSIAAIKRSEQ